MSVFERFVATRYLLDRDARREGRGFVRFVIFVGIGGVTVGVAALLIALSVVRGFSLEIKDKIEGLGAHLQVKNQTDAPLREAAELIDGIRGLDGVTEVRAVVEDYGLIRRSPTNIEGVFVSGVEMLPSYLHGHVVEGTPSFGGGQGMLVGRTLAELQELTVGDHVTVFAFSRRGGSSPVAGRPRVRQYTVNGLFETSLENFDETVVFTDLRTASELFGFEQGEVTRLDVTVSDGVDRLALRDEIESRFGFPVIVHTIEEVHRSLFAWIQLQESIIPVVIGFIVLVAIFNIGGILLMIVMEKTRSIGVLVGMGTAARSIRKVVLTLSGLIGVIGIVSGSVLALGLSLIQKRFEVIPLPADAYYMTAAPIQIQPLDYVVVAVATFCLCLVFAYIPARFAARLDPIQVIRFQ